MAKSYLSTSSIFVWKDIPYPKIQTLASHRTLVFDSISWPMLPDTSRDSRKGYKKPSGLKACRPDVVDRARKSKKTPTALQDTGYIFLLRLNDQVTSNLFKKGSWSLNARRVIKVPIRWSCIKYTNYILKVQNSAIILMNSTRLKLI